MFLGPSRFAIAAGLIASAAAQTYSDCNPMTNTSCSADTGLSLSTYSIDFTDGSADDDNWESVGSGDVEYTSAGAKFTINEKGDAPTIQSSWYIFFGRVEVHLKAASGTGIVSSAVLLSDVLDEVDWEWLGGSTNEVQTNYYGKGNDTSDTRSATVAVSDSQTTSHNYTIYWTKESCVWYIDDAVIRTLNYADALNGENYPQTPMRVKLGIWAGGDSDNAEGTITWAGGETDYDDGPFTMTVESIKIENFNPAGAYTYGDQTGDYTSIELEESDESDSTSTASTKTSSSKASSTASTNFQNKGAVNSESSSTPSTTGTPTASVETTSLGAIMWPNMWLLVSAFAATAAACM
ncbi:murein transglycosylase [Fusarium albosuccineum]|uniref:Crh-like protein n=1 Tax=Fusarium albosuccineum TaxID=1237068 RepID=A0A8H4P3F1_9HYPO|nr:murein transglycosylase [Fusarium albosuccineum]